MPLLSFVLQLGNPTPAPVAMMALAANFMGQADLDWPVPSSERAVQRQQQPKTHGDFSSDLAGALLCCWQPFLNSAFCLAGYTITAMISTHWVPISPEAACLGTYCGTTVVAKS